MNSLGRGVRPRVFLFFLAWFAGLGLAISSPAHADILHGIGVIGDSGSVRSPSYKWPAQLQTYRGLNFGGSGLPYDHAVGGATSATLLTQGQHTQMATDVGNGKVTLGITFIGNNDFGTSAGLAIAGGTATPAQTTSFQNSVVNNIKTAVNTEISAGIQGMLLGSVEDVTLTPSGQSVGDPDAVARVKASVNAINSQLLSYANTLHIPFVDFSTLGNDVYASGLTVGGVPINLIGSGSAPNNFWIDGLHPGAVGNAILGNMWMEAMNIAYGTHLTLFSDQEILAMAGLSGYTGETFSSSYNLANYIHFTPVPEPGAFVLIGTALVLLAARKARTRRV